jgi:hypothetical protein
MVVVLRFFKVPGVTATPKDLESIPETTAAERAVADLLPIDAGVEEARAALEGVPLWFHTFSLSGAGVYTPGIARDHRYRLRAIPEQLMGARVLDVGTFDGFYAFLAERRGAARVVAVDNEQYVGWIRSRFGAELVPGAGFRAIAELLNSGVVYRRFDLSGQRGYARPPRHPGTGTRPRGAVERLQGYVEGSPATLRQPGDFCSDVRRRIQALLLDRSVAST